MTNAEATIVGAIIGGALSIAATIFGGRCLVAFQNRRNAEQVFWDAVHEILEGMYPEPLAWPRNSQQILQGKAPLMHSAIEKLKFHLKPDEVAKIDVAWKECTKFFQQINDREIKAYRLYPRLSSIDQKAEFKRRVDALLSCLRRPRVSKTSLNEGGHPP